MKFEFTFKANGEKYVVSIHAMTPENAWFYWDEYKSGLEKKHRVQIEFLELVEVA